MTKRQTLSRSIVEILRRSDVETLQMAYTLQKIVTHLNYEGKPSWGKNLREGGKILHSLKRHLSCHLNEEERIVFPFLKTHIPKLEPLIAILHSEHEDLRKSLRRFQFWLGKLGKEKNKLIRRKGIERLRGMGIYLTCLLQSHAQEEIKVLYKVAEKELWEGEKKSLLQKISKESGNRSLMLTS